MTDPVVALEAWFAKHHDGGMHPACFGHGACMAGQAEAEIARLRNILALHNKTPTGRTRKCLPGCLACAALEEAE